ncbi:MULTISPECIES: chemotaxis protein CheW [unclassified Duganella]|uniref:chemotaxis protein CheW n=1 Tax=unclassified Duganella TaxID=2636909 RepID=UPI000E34C6FB|nr:MULTISPECIES: chemotaxis protein CheW [unclassified Duganella]RFP07968.1 chemotaxis protein CheW [Duganella sp. BJB475]RFP21456.1 chemotaxis protein CheW [Duganella sp. BJB476]
MKLLIFHIGADRYGLRLRDVVRVLPLLELKHLPLAPDAVAGLMDFHGQSVPVIDLCRASGMASGADHFDTRIIVVDYHAPEGTDHLLGLRAERVLGVQEVAEAQLANSGVLAAPFLGQVASDAAGMLQLVELEQLLPASLRTMLFQT